MNAEIENEIDCNYVDNFLPPLMEMNRLYHQYFIQKKFDGQGSRKIIHLKKIIDIVYQHCNTKAEKIKKYSAQQVPCYKKISIQASLIRQLKMLNEKELTAHDMENCEYFLKHFIKYVLLPDELKCTECNRNGFLKNTD